MLEKGCVFCDRRQLAQSIIHENQDFFFIASLGQLTDGGHVLVVPKRHIPCFGDIHQNKIGQVLRAMDTASLAIDLEYKSGHLIFEHGKTGQTIDHAHFHVLPVSKNLNILSRVRKDFSVAEIDMVEHPTDFLFRTSENGCKEPYLFWQEADGSAYVCWNPQASPQYLRSVVASALGRPERADWRKVDPELDKRFITETITRLKPYFTLPANQPASCPPKHKKC